nr:hypothetical protein [Ensifer sp. BR816]
MYRLHHQDMPEQRASTALPISLLLLSVGVILAYLAIGGAWSENNTEIVVYTPQTSEVSNTR